MSDIVKNKATILKQYIEREINHLIGADAQGLIVSKIFLTAYKINQENILSVVIVLKTYSLHLIAKHALGGEEVLNEVCGLGESSSQQIGSMLIFHLNKLLDSLEKIYRDRTAPQDGVA